VTAAARNLSGPHGTTPIPDPTVLTTQQLLREIEALKELVIQRIVAIEQAVSVAHENLVRVPTDTDKAISHLNQLFAERLNTISERFAAVQTQFKERDTRVEQIAELGDQALKAALQAAKELVGKQNDYFVTSIAKSETATNKQIDQLQQLINTVAGASSSKVDDLKERILRLEGEGRGEKNAAITKVQSTQSSISVLGLVIFGGLTFLSLIVSLIALYTRLH
jgi:hypothetical protein